MALTWNDRTRRAQSGQAASESYQAEVPHWGEASVHTHIHHPGEVFLECHALGIEMHPLGRVESVGTRCGAWTPWPPSGARRDSGWTRVKRKWPRPKGCGHLSCFPPFLI